MKNRPEVIFENEDLIAINKPSGLLSVPDRYDANKPNADRWLKARYDVAMSLHRLDRETSGILCFAKNDVAYKHFSMAFQERDVRKYYTALVLGVPRPDKGTIDKPLLRMDFQNVVVISPKGKPATTHYEVVESFGAFSHLRLNIITGRTHQIRVHLQSIGHPLIVDPAYGGKENFFLSEVKTHYRNRGEERPLLTRTPLHACKIVLPDLDGSSLTIEASLPKDMKAVLNQLHKCTVR